MSPPGREGFRPLEGLRLTSVVFVMDYLQLIFDRVGLSLFVWPSIVAADGAHDLDWVLYEKTLRSLIGTKVLAVGVSTRGWGVSLSFGETRIEIAPLDSELSGPEIVELCGVSAPSSVAIWRHGDEPFRSH